MLEGTQMTVRIQTGDVVTLRCGGIEMVVVDTLLPGNSALRKQIGVAWIDKRGQAKRGVFPSCALCVLRAREDN